VSKATTDDPSLAALGASARVVSLPLTTRFRGIAVREVMLFDGPAGWAEWGPFVEYEAAESARWLAAAIEAGWGDWPTPVRATIPVNAIVPAVPPAEAARLVQDSGGCRTAKVKVAEPGQTLDDDVARVAAVRRALDELGVGGRVRVDANGAWTVIEALDAVRELSPFGLEYVEQPCATLADLARLRRLVDIPVAVDEGVRKAADPDAVAGLREAADVVIVKVAPLGGVKRALRVAERAGLPAVVSSALDSSIGLAAGAALAAALPQLPYACGLGSGRLLDRDIVTDRVLPDEGVIRVGRRIPAPSLVEFAAAEPERVQWWHRRLESTYRALVESQLVGPGSR